MSVFVNHKTEIFGCLGKEGAAVLGKLIAGMMILGAGALLLKGEDGLLKALLAAGGDAVATGIALAGSFAVFSGLVEILRRAGMAGALCRAVRRPLTALLGKGAPTDALPDVALNLSLNMLGLGGAATPVGVRAAQRLAPGGQATNALCLFLVLNTSSMQLFSSSVIALRAAAGSACPEAAVLPTLLASLCSTAAGVGLCKALERLI